MPLAVFFILKIWLFEGLTWFYKEFRIVLFFCEKCQWNFDKHCIESVDWVIQVFKQYSSIHDHGILLLCVFNFYQCLTVYRSFISSVKFISTYFMELCVLFFFFNLSFCCFIINVKKHNRFVYTDFIAVNFTEFNFVFLFLVESFEFFNI